MSMSEEKTVAVRRLGEAAHLMVAALRNLQTALSAEDRTALWAFMQQGYCKACGRTTEFICHCENDE